MFTVHVKIRQRYCYICVGSAAPVLPVCYPQHLLRLRMSDKYSALAHMEHRFIFKRRVHNRHSLRRLRRSSTFRTPGVRFASSTLPQEYRRVSAHPGTVGSERQTDPQEMLDRRFGPAAAAERIDAEGFR
jgi:hypothetical protein